MRRNPAFQFIIVAALLVSPIAALPQQAHADPGPVPSVAVPSPGDVFLNEGFTLSLSFDNTGDATGFGPVVELMVPPGVDADESTASFLGVPVNAIDAGIFDSSGQLTNPLTNATVTGPEGYRLLVVEYPLGSFTVTQPAAVVKIDCNLNPDAELGVPETFLANPLFRFGVDPENNPTSDPPIYGVQTSHDVIPSVITLAKTSDADEAETATGPNYPVTYTLTVDIATDADIEDLQVTDQLPANLQFIQVTDNGGASSVTEPSTAVPGGTLVFDFAGTTTGVSGPDIIIEYTVYAPELDAADEPVINPATGAAVSAENDAEVEGDYDDGDGGVQVAADADYTLTFRSIAIQKDSSIVADVGPGGTSPGDTVEYTIEFQISDYFAFQDIVVTDVVGDGQTFVDSPPPHLTVMELGSSDDWDFIDGDTYSWSHNSSTGETTLIFDVSQVLADENFGTNGNGSLEGDEYTDDNPDGEPATGTITFRTVIDEAYEDTGDYPAPYDEYLSAGDSTDNEVIVEADLLGTSTAVTDDSGATLTIAVPDLAKTVYAINGDTGFGDVLVGPGETVTFSLRIVVSAGETEQLVLTDYLPIPFLDATELTTYDSSQSSTPPAAGSWKLGPDDTLSGGLSPLLAPPSFSTDGAENTVSFDWGSFQETDATERIAHILFTLTGTDAPMADELFLADVAVKACEDSQGIDHVDTAVDHIITQEPHLTITKGIAATSGGGTIDPAPGILPIDGDLAGADADDAVTYVITVANDGSWPAYDVTIVEDTPAGLSGCAIVTDGVRIDGTPTAAYSGDVFAAGLTLTNPLGAGETLTIEYDCTLDSDVYPRQEILNTAQVTEYTNTDDPAAPNFVQDQSLYEDTALVTVADPGLSKTVDSTSEPSTTDSDLTIGERVTFEVVLTLPEGQTTNLILTDDIPDGFRYEDGSLSVDSVGAAITPGAPVTIAPASPHAFSQGEDISISWAGVTTVSGASSSSDRQIVISLDATVVDHVSNDWEDPSKTNTVALDWDENPSAPVTDDASLTIVEPDLIVTKSISPNPAYGGQTVTVTLAIENQGTSDAFDVEVTDPLDTDVFDTSGGATDTTTSLNGFTFGYADPTVTYSGGTIEAGDTQVFSFTVDILDLVLVGSTYPNVATADYSSLPGDGDDERDYQDTGDQDLAISRTGIGKSIVATSEPNSVTSGTDVVIGEVVTYQVTLDLPASTTSDSLEVADNLPPNVSYIAGTSEISRSSSAVASTAFAAWAATDGDFAPIAPTGSPDPLEFDLGDVTNSDSTGQSIRIRFDVVVDNEGVNQRGTNIFNRATASFENDSGQTITVRSNRVSSRVKVPALSVTKTATPASAIGGDTVGFTVVAENQSLSHAGPAFELNVYDPLDPYYGPISGLGWVVSGSGVTVDDNTSGSTLDIDIDRLDPGESVTISFSADLPAGIPHGVTVPNTSLFTGTSLPGDNGTGDATPGAPGDPTGERTGTGGVNDLRDTSSQEVTIDLPTINKSIVDEQSSYVIGETIAYEVVIGVPTGFSECLRLIDTLPDGVTYETGSLDVTLPGTISVENTPLTEGNATFFTLAGQELQLEFGEVSASSSADMVVTYNVTVDNVLGNQNGTSLQNVAELHQRDPDTGECVLIDTSSTETIVGEPYVEVEKQIVSSTAGIEAGDEVQYQVAVENTGNETAYGLILTDVVSPGNAFADIVASSVSATFSPEPTFDEGTMSMGPFDLAPGESVTLLFTAEINTLSLGETVTNTASVEFSSQAGGEGRTGDGTSDQDDNATLNNYNEADDASFQMDAFVGLEKALCPCLPDHEFTIGERVVFRIQIDVLEATTEDVIVTDTLPEGLIPLPGDAQVIAGNAGMSFEDPGNPGNPQPDYDVPAVSGQELTFELGNIVNPDNGNDLDDYVVIDIHAYVANVSENQNGDALTNEVEVTWTEEGESQSLTDTEDAPIVEPDLEVTKEAGLSELTIGDEVTYTITVRHTDQSAADAHDIVVVDTPGPDMDYVVGSCSLPAAQVDHDADPGETLTFTIPLLTLADHEVAFTYRCALEFDETLVDPPVIQDNDAVLTWTSLPGDEDNERTGDDGVAGDLNDYADTDSEDVTPIIRTTIDVDKSVVDVNGGDLVGGDVLEYTVVIVNTVGTAHDVVFTDPIPAATSYVPGSLTCDKPGAVLNDSSDPLVVEIGDMAEDEVVTITFRVVVDPRAPRGTVIENHGSVDSDDTTPEPTDDPDDPEDDDPTDIEVDRPLPVVGGEVIRPDKSELIRIQEALSAGAANSFPTGY